MVNVTEEMKNAFDAIIHEAEKQVKENSDAELVIVAHTAKDKIYSCANYGVMEGKYEDTERFLQMLVEVDDAEIKYCVCMLSSGWLEPPYECLRKGLLRISPKNEETIFCGQGENVLVLKTVKDMMPL